MAGALSDDSSTLTTWKLTNRDWEVVDSGTFDRGACGDIDDRDGLYFFATQEKTLASVGEVNWRPTSDGWSCTPGPHIGIAAGHGLFVGTGESELDSPDASFWRSDDGLDWTKTQPASNGPRVTAVADGFVAIAGGEWNDPVNEIWTSVDAESWAQQPTPFDGTFLDRLVSDGQRAATLEDADQPGTKAPGAIWVSSHDGAEWTRYQLPPKTGDFATFVAIWGNRLVVTGVSEIGGNPTANQLVWSADI